MNIVMSGHLGLIGSSLSKRLQAEGHSITKTFDKKDGTPLDTISEYSPEEEIDLFIHAAAHCKINQSITDPERDFQSNVVGTHKVFEFCRKNKVPKVINFSTSRVLSPERNPYTAGKLFGEELCDAYSRCYGLDFVIVRPSTVYGPFMDTTRRLTHIFITNALEGRDLEIYGDPKTKTLDFTYVDDFVDATMLAMAQRNESFDISGNQETNVYTLAKFIIEHTNSNSKIKILPPEYEQPQKVRLDTSKIRALGYTPKVSLEEGMKRTIDWYRENI